jgi:Lar family restriction alleviation protein
MSVKPELKSCPFCGGEACYTRAVNGTGVHRVGCSACGIAFKSHEIHYPDPSKDHLSKDIVAMWNRRTS